MNMAVIGRVIAQSSVAAQPMWPYIVGGITAILLAAYGAVNLVGTWRRDLQNEASQKTRNIEALEANTKTAAANTDAINNLTVKLEEFMFTTHNRLTELEWYTGYKRRLPGTPSVPPRGEDKG